MATDKFGYYEDGTKMTNNHDNPVYVLTGTRGEAILFDNGYHVLEIHFRDVVEEFARLTGFNPYTGEPIE